MKTTYKNSSKEHIQEKYTRILEEKQYLISNLKLYKVLLSFSYGSDIVKNERALYKWRSRLELVEKIESVLFHKILILTFRN